MLPGMSIDAFFFDIDGTLVDSNGLHVRAWHEAFVLHGKEISREAIRKQIGKGADMLIPALLPDSAPALRKAIDTAHGQIFKSRYLQQVKPFHRATDLIQALHEKGIQIVLASSAQPHELEHYVHLLGIAPMLSGTVTSHDVERSKPAADIFAVALNKVAPIPAAATLAVGDTPYDVQSAKRNGIETLAVRSGAFSDSELKEPGALAVYDNVAAVLGDLERVLTLLPATPQRPR
jgi:beta-phosphoglucomutase-like phosphatase (HAD superfamily)